MDIAPQALEPPDAAPQRTRGADNPIVRGVARVPLPLRAKLLIGFAVVGALLAIGYVLGVVALGRSNSRGQELRRLQQRAVYEQLLLTDAHQLSKAIEYRISFVPNKHFGGAVDQTIENEVNQLCDDAGLAGCIGQSDPTPLPITLATIDHTLYGRLQDQSFFNFQGAAGLGVTLRRALGFTQSFSAKLEARQRSTQARANALVAADRSSFTRSRNLLIGVGAGSLLLAALLGLLLSSSVVAPLRRTRSRLAAIAAGDFSDRLELANRDEIGALAADVNSMSDELHRVYEELALASEHKSRFLATVSHELRTPLNAIIGFSEILHEQMFGELNDRQLAYVDDIREAGKHQLSLINELLDLAKIEAGRMDLELSEVALPEIMHSAVSLHQEQANRAGVELSLRTEPEEITVRADERRVRQVVFNLVSNAVKFTPNGGRVEISARLEDGQVEVGVADTGPGIAAGDQETIFEEFEQGPEGRRAEGTGLGLPLSRKLVELHGGRLWVESEVGRGSIFRFTLPVRQEVG